MENDDIDERMRERVRHGLREAAHAKLQQRYKKKELAQNARISEAPTNMIFCVAGCALGNGLIFFFVHIPKFWLRGSVWISYCDRGIMKNYKLYEEDL